MKLIAIARWLFLLGQGLQRIFSAADALIKKQDGASRILVYCGTPTLRIIEDNPAGVT
jgi:hypothetical protein